MPGTLNITHEDRGLSLFPGNSG